MLRVLQVGKFYPPYRGGMETHLHTLCLGLRPHVDMNVVVANSGRRRSEEFVDGIAVTRLGTILNIRSAPLIPGLAAVIRRSQADIVHMHFPHPTAVLAYLASGHHGRLVVTYHSDIVRQRVLGLAFRPFLHRILDQCAAIICTSPNYIDSSPILTAHRERCHVLPFGIPTPPAEREVTELARDIRARYGPGIVLAVGRLVSYKGFDYLIRAMASVPGRLLLVGRGPLRGRLERVASKSGVADRVVFLAEVDDVTPYYHAADVFVLPSVARSEAFGLVQLEAMAAGVPVVNTQLASGVPYVAPHRVTGITVPPRNSAALAEAVTTLLEDEELRKRMGMAGQQRFHSHFSVDIMVRQTMALYRAAMQVPPRRPIDRSDLPFDAAPLSGGPSLGRREYRAEPL